MVTPRHSGNFVTVIGGPNLMCSQHQCLIICLSGVLIFGRYLVFLGNISSFFLSTSFLFFLVSCFTSVKGITRSHAQLLPHTGPFLWWCPWPRALPTSVSSKFWLPSLHSILSLLWSPLIFYLQKCWNNFFVIEFNQIGLLQECVIEAFLWFPLGCSQL